MAFFAPEDGLWDPCMSVVRWEGLGRVVLGLDLGETSRFFLLLRPFSRNRDQVHCIDSCRTNGMSRLQARTVVGLVEIEAMPPLKCLAKRSRKKSIYMLGHVTSQSHEFWGL